jgi:hypothetical protein
MDRRLALNGWYLGAARFYRYGAMGGRGRWAQVGGNPCVEALQP